ncbi:MAG: DNA repair protein RadA [Microgenomates group bacterium]
MKQRSSFVCQQCSAEFPQWYGKCPNCDSWNSLVETVKESESTSSGAFHKKVINATAPQKLSAVKHIEKNRLKSGIPEFDRVMGGGIVPGSVTLLAGDPGVGKSTLLLHVLSPIGGLYVSGEESSEQIKLRAKRMGIDGENIMVLAETVLEGITEALSKNTSFPLIIIDSIQTIASNELEGMAGSVGQIRYCAEELVNFAKSKGVPILIIGHVTKEGEIAGPKVLEHMVDTVLYLEGERYQDARILRTLKNRFGAVEEVGIFEMKENGLKEIANPSELFLQDRVKNVPGSVVTVILEGTRPLLVEIQALVVPSQIPIPRRVANGFDYNRLQLLIAILQKRCGLPLGTSDVFVNVSGGLKITERACDLAVAAAIISSYKNIALDTKTALFGEVGLLGEVRHVGQEERREKEAKRLGFTTVLASKTTKNLQQLQKILQ